MLLYIAGFSTATILMLILGCLSYQYEIKRQGKIMEEQIKESKYWKD